MDNEVQFPDNRPVTNEQPNWSYDKLLANILRDVENAGGSIHMLNEIGTQIYCTHLIIEQLKSAHEHDEVVDMVEMVREFNTKFGLPYEDGPRPLTKEMYELRIKQLYEEVKEYEDADTLEDEFDALIDLVYFALGTAYLQGFPFVEGFKRVHEANMKKRRAKKATDSKRGSSLDIVKPKGWKPPVLTDLVERNTDET